MKRVFVVAGHALFSQGIKNLLDAAPGLTIVGWETELTDAIKHIADVQPDTVLHIIEDSGLATALTSEALLKLGVKAKLVELNLKDTHMYVYQGEQLIAREIEDLISVI